MASVYFVQQVYVVVKIAWLLLLPCVKALPTRVRLFVAQAMIASISFELTEDQQAYKFKRALNKRLYLFICAIAAGRSFFSLSFCLS